MPQLILEGHVYIVVAPLYRILYKDSTSVYLKDDAALKQYRKEHKNENYTVLRYKGLGELDVNEAKEVLMNPQKRTLKRITIEDAKEAAEIFEILMGKDAQLRKQFIEENSYLADLSSL